MGRKGKYQDWLKPENLILIQGWRRDGLSDAQIAKNIGVSCKTLYEWLNKYSEFSNAYKKGSEVSSYEVENAAYKSALGHYVEEIEIIETDSDRDGHTVTKKKHRRYIPPNSAMIIFILKNRLSDKWKDTRTIESKSDGQLAALIDGLKEPADNSILGDKKDSGDNEG